MHRLERQQNERGRLKRPKRTPARQSAELKLKKCGDHERKSREPLLPIKKATFEIKDDLRKKRQSGLDLNDAASVNETTFASPETNKDRPDK